MPRPAPLEAARPPRPPRRRAAAPRFGLAILAATSIAPAAARADGAYGRLDGDLELRASAGAALAEGGPALAASAAVLYLGTAGVYAHYADALDRGAAPVARSFAAGVHLQPMFLGRYASDLERGPPRLDLLLDSIGLGVGAFWSAPRGRGLVDEPGLELALSIAFPVLPDATGPFLDLRGALRWRAADLAGDGPGDLVAQGALLSLTLGWHHVVTGHVVDAGDAVERARRGGSGFARALRPVAPPARRGRGAP